MGASPNVVLIVLSPDALNSGWVRAELDAKLIDEFSHKQIRVVPLLLRSVIVPPLLRGKIYVDFRREYDTAFELLLNALSDCPDYTRFEDRDPDRNFLEKVPHRSFSSGVFGFLFPALLQGGIIAYLHVLYHGSHNIAFNLISKVLFGSTSLALCAIIFLTVLGVRDSRRWAKLQGRAHQVNLFRSSVEATHRGLPTFPRLSDVAIVTEKIAVSQRKEKVSEINTATELAILFTIWNNNPFAIKVFEISTQIHAKQQACFYVEGPRALVIIDQDKSLANQTDTYEIPAGESYSFNLAYRIARSHRDYLAFSLLLKYTEPTGATKHVASDALYFDFGGETAVFVRKGEVYTGNSDSQRKFVDKAVQMYFGALSKIHE